MTTKNKERKIWVCINGHMDGQSISHVVDSKEKSDLWKELTQPVLDKIIQLRNSKDFVDTDTSNEIDKLADNHNLDCFSNYLRVEEYDLR